MRQFAELAGISNPYLSQIERGLRAPSENVLEGIAGAIWHTMRCQVANGRIQLLSALSDYLSYMVLTPFIGAEVKGEGEIE